MFEIIEYDIQNSDTEIDLPLFTFLFKINEHYMTLRFLTDIDFYSNTVYLSGHILFLKDMFNFIVRRTKNLNICYDLGTYIILRDKFLTIYYKNKLIVNGLLNDLKLEEFRSFIKVVYDIMINNKIRKLTLDC